MWPSSWASRWSSVKLYPERLQTQYEHAWEIRDLLGYRDFADAEAEVTAFVASRVAKTRDSRRDLFDRAVLWLIEGRVLLPGMTTMSRLVTEVRRVGLEEINQVLAGPRGAHAAGVDGTLEVPDGKKVSTLEWMRTPVTKLSGTGMSHALDRARMCWGWAPGRWTARRWRR